jgi:broad specificity phosphatase PhoE
VDSPLTDTGRWQARNSLQHLPESVAWIVSSPLCRAVGTALIVLDAMKLDIELEIDARVTEYDVGRAGGLPIRDITTEELVSQFGAEDPNEFGARVTSVIDELVQREGIGLLVSHAGVARAYLARQEGFSPAEFRTMPLPKNAVPFLMI